MYDENKNLKKYHRNHENEIYLKRVGVCGGQRGRGVEMKHKTKNLLEFSQMFMIIETIN